MLGMSETGILVHHESYECKCRLNERLCNSKQTQNHDKSWCECKICDDWNSCNDDYMWNPSTCDCECNKACRIDEIQKFKIVLVKNI